jgi:hypothetical protein
LERLCGIRPIINEQEKVAITKGLHRTKEERETHTYFSYGYNRREPVDNIKKPTYHLESYY